MTIKLKYHKNYTQFGGPYHLVLPLNLEGLVPDDDSVRLLNHELEDLDYSSLYQAYSAKGRNLAVNPKIIFKILIYAYTLNIYPEKLKPHAGVTLTLCDCLPGKKLPITAPSPVSEPVFWQMPVKIFFIKWSAA